jgi:hypothetical protein
MSKEEIKVRQWPFDATMESINGSGFDTSTIRRLNEHGTEEQKSNFIHERRKDAGLGALALGVIVGSNAIYGEVAHGKVWGYQNNSSPTEQSAADNQSSNQTEFRASTGQKINLQTHEQAQETLSQLHK